ncbi:hypothetical protein JHK85_046810 [Glycine max]|nr:hypothetical protein JHK85_046810 [Glycine max]
MQVFSNARRASWLLLFPHLRTSEAPHSTALSLFSGLAQRDSRQVNTDPVHCLSKAFFSSGMDTVEATPSEDVKELYDKMLDSVKVKRSMPPNAWLWSMIANCKQQHDIRLLFDILQNLRRFRLSNLRIHDNFNCNLCREVAKACVHAGALDFGHTESLWKIEKLRSESMKQHTLITGFSCVKGLLLERKPSDAVAVIQVLNQTLSDTKKSGIKGELQKLVSEWPLEVIKHQKEEDRKALSASLKSDILVMVSELLSVGLDANVSLEDLDRKECIPR